MTDLDSSWPHRIVCLTAETPSILWRLGVGDRVVGISGFTREPRALRGRPKVGGFTEIDLQKVVDLDPDLVIAYSNLQAPVVGELVRRGITVLALNQTDLAGIGRAILLLARSVGRPAAGRRLIARFQRELEAIAARAAGRPRPRVFFEEWPEPLIPGSPWISEIIELAGGIDVCADRRHGMAGARIIDPLEVARRDPEIILASWCGRKVRREAILNRTGWEQVTAVRCGDVYELLPDEILHPGPELLKGARRVERILDNWRNRRRAGVGG